MLPEGSPAEEQVARILQAAEKAADLTNQMLAYAGKQDFEVGFVDLNQLVIPRCHPARSNGDCQKYQYPWDVGREPTRHRGGSGPAPTSHRRARYKRLGSAPRRTWRGLDSHGSTQERSLGNTRLRRDLRHRARHGRRDLPRKSSTPSSPRSSPGGGSVWRPCRGSSEPTAVIFASEANWGKARP